MTAGVAGVAFYGVDCAVFDLFDDADMVGNAVLTAFVGEVPIEEDDITGAGRVGVILPLFTGPQHRGWFCVLSEIYDFCYLSTQKFSSFPKKTELFLATQRTVPCVTMCEIETAEILIGYSIQVRGYRYSNAGCTYIVFRGNGGNYMFKVICVPETKAFFGKYLN